MINLAGKYSIYLGKENLYDDKAKAFFFCSIIFEFRDC